MNRNICYYFVELMSDKEESITQYFPREGKKFIKILFKVVVIRFKNVLVVIIKTIG